MSRIVEGNDNTRLLDGIPLARGEVVFLKGVLLGKGEHEWVPGYIEIDQGEFVFIWFRGGGTYVLAIPLMPGMEFERG